MKIVTESGLKTQEFGEKFAKQIKGNNLICLYGDLGSGKTTFTQGFAKGLGIKKRVTSPTFVIVKQYEIKNLKLKIKNLLHIDCYRIKSLNIQEFLETKTNLVIIEWPQNIELVLPKKRIDIQFNYLDELRREIEINYR